MRINNIQNNINFGYNKRLDKNLKIRLDNSPNTIINRWIRQQNDTCNKIEKEIIRLEGKKLEKVYQNEKTIEFLTDYFIGAKVLLCLVVDKFFPDLCYLKASQQSYEDEAMKKIEKSGFELGVEYYLDDDIDEEDKEYCDNPLPEGTAYNWRKELFADLQEKIDSPNAPYTLQCIKSIENMDAAAIFSGTLDENDLVKVLGNKENSNLTRKYVPTQDSPKSLDDVFGLNDVRKDITDLVVYPLENPEQALERKENYGIDIPGFIVFSGPPGCGKTMLAQAISAQTGCDMYMIDISTIGGIFVNSSVQNLTNAYNSIKKIAKDSEKPVIIFMDEMDSIASKRASGSGKEDNKVLTTLLPMIVEAQNNNIVIIGATNLYDALDPAVKSRINFDRYIGLPKQNELPDFLRSLLQKTKKGQTLAQNNEDLVEISKRLTNYSPRTIKAIFQKAALIASSNGRDFQKQDFFDAIKENNWERINEKEYKPKHLTAGNSMGFVTT